MVDHVKIVLYFSTLCIILSCLHKKPDKQVHPRPNIILILADDLGYDDLSMRNPVFNTPNIDLLATESVQFEKFYVNAVCAPTRASLLTGRHFLRTGVSHVHGGKDFIHLNEILLPQTLKANGYVTGMWGKWHSGHTPGYYPWERGFDEAYMANLYKHEKSNGLLNGREVSHDKWADEVIVDYALEFIKNHQKRPFFAFISSLTPHLPLAAPEAYKQKYLSDGYSENFSSLLSMVEHFDHQLGRILKSLDELQLSKNTVVIFLSDNGPQILTRHINKEERKMRYASQMKGHKGDIWENGIKSPLFVRWTGNLNPQKISRLVDVTDLYPTLIELAGNKIPDNQLPTDGRSILPYLRGDTISLQARVSFDYTHQAWVPDDNLSYTIDGVHSEYDPVDKDKLSFENQILYARLENVKLMFNPQKTPFGNALPKKALFDTAIDPGENRGLEALYPEMTTSMMHQLNEWFSGIKKEKNSFTMPVFQIGMHGYKKHEIPGTGPAKISKNLQNTVTMLKYWKEVGDFSEYALQVHRDGRYQVSLWYEKGECSSLPTMRVLTKNDTLTQVLTEKSFQNMGVLKLEKGRQNFRLELADLGNTPCHYILNGIKKIELSQEF